MTTKFTIGFCLACSAILLPGCVDKNYDLADVDGTTRIPVDNVTVPLNLDPIKFGDILEPEGKVRTITIEGKTFYAFVEEGDFSTNSAVKIQTFFVQGPQINPSHSELQPIANQSAPGRQAPAFPSFSLKNEDITSFDYLIKDIPAELTRLDYITAQNPFRYTMTLSFPQLAGLAGSVKDVTLRDVSILLPKGLDVTIPYGSFSPSTGIWSIPEITFTGSSAEITLLAKGINTTPEYANAHINANRTMDLHGDFDIIDGTVTINPTSTPDLSQIPSTLTLDINYRIESFTVKYISGAIDYKLEGLNIDPASLTDIPDFLKGDENVVRLANPQIYFQVNNPVSQYSMDCTLGLSLGAVRENSVRTFSPDGPIVINNAYGDGPYNYALAVDKNNLYYPAGDIDYKVNSKFISFPTIGNLLAPEAGQEEAGLPSEIEINIIDPKITSNSVTDFELGKTYDNVKGNYQLIAPIALTGDSRILYEKAYTGWNDDSLNDVTITALSMSADYNNAAPVAITLYIYPTDKEGKPYGKGQQAVISSTTLEAGSSGELIINLTKESDVDITGLDGMHLYVVLDNPNGETLSPDQTLSLQNIRITISGYYQTDFK